MGQPITVVDAFTDTAFGGNPAGVCVLPTPADETWMQSVATELNLPMTAFLVRRTDGEYDLRWFSPTTEVSICGHATLASAHVLGQSVRFHTKSGVLSCRPADDGTLEMEFPAIPGQRATATVEWSEALGLAPEQVVGLWSAGEWGLVEVATPADLRTVVPNRSAILGLGGAVIVVATPGDREGVDSVCRVFSPSTGNDEDAVTGSAHCVIGPWLAERTGRNRLTGYQASARGGTVGMRVAGSQVMLSGRAVTVLTGTLDSDPQGAGGQRRSAGQGFDRSERSGQPMAVVDAFTDRAFGGNPAGVCLVSAPAREGWMQAVAAEMNLSETAFVAPRADGDHDLRWFTPTTEVDLCGHATLASTHLLGVEARFHTRSGILTCRTADDGTIEMDFPAVTVEPVSDPPDWPKALGITPERVLGVWSGGDWALVELSTPADVRAVVADRDAILGLGGSVIVVATPERDHPESPTSSAGPPGGSVATGAVGSGVDSVCRVFVPGAGLDEDPVTGSAHCVIGPWLAERTGRDQFTGHQASARGGTVGMRVVGDRVLLSGRAVKVLDAVLHAGAPAAP